MPESTQHKLDRVRPPRVQITYDVEIGDAIEKKQLPLVAGILADLAGKPADAPPPLKKRKFVEIDRDNFHDVLAASAPRLALRADLGMGALEVVDDPADAQFDERSDHGGLDRGGRGWNVDDNDRRGPADGNRACRPG